MSNTKTVMGQASNQYVVPLDITDVFSTYLYTGTGSAQTITNGIDLDGEGGLVWFKMRNAGFGHRLVDTERGVTKKLESYNTAAEGTEAQGLTAFNSNGFTVGSHDNYNANTYDFASWTFRKAPKFFDVGTISFDGSGVGSYSHNLGSVPGMVILKLTNTTGDWFVWHKDLTSQNYAMFLNATAAESNQGGWATYTDTAVSFDSSVFANDTAVVYLFAHNDGDGEFGPDDSDIIKCGSFTVGGSGTTVPINEIDLGFEAQWVLYKRTDSINAANSEWRLADIMRGTPVGEGYQKLNANDSSAEAYATYEHLYPTSTGFNAYFPGTSSYPGAGASYIYMAIRRGPLAPPESATEVFAIDTRAGGTPSFISSFPVDMGWKRTVNAGSQTYVASRLTGTNFLATSSTAAQSTDNGFVFDYMNGWADDGLANSNVYSWMWRRAPGYFDALAYTGTGSARDLPHNLQAVPEMYWIKGRDEDRNWIVYADINGTYKEGLLNSNSAFGTASSIGGDPTDSVLKVGTTWNENRPNYNYIACLFASLPGISKVGSFVIDNSGGTLDVNCGFASGARFVLFKRSSGVGSWYVFDSERGITGNADPYLTLNSTNAEDTWNVMTPLSSGFTIANNGSTGSGTYIFYAIA